MRKPEWGNIFKKSRINKGISLKQAAEDLGFSISKLRDMEDGKKNVNIEHLHLICDYLDITEEVLETTYIELQENKSNPKEVGSKLRHYRKMKKISLQEIAEKGIFSIGKLSNIENGTTKVNVEDVKILCDYIGIPIELILDTNRGQRLEKAKTDLSRAKNYLVLDLHDSALPLLDSVAQQIETDRLDEIEFFYEIVMGFYYLQQKDMGKAKQYLVQGMNKIVPENENHELFLQTVHALTYISFVQHKFTEALQYAQKSKEVQDPELSSKEDQANTLFNLSIMCLLNGLFENAIFYAKQSYEKATGSLKYDISFLLAVIHFVTEEYEASHEEIKRVMNYYRREKDKTRYAKVLNLAYHIYKKFPLKFKYEIYDIENKVTKEIHPQSNEDAIYLLELHHLIIHHAIEEKNYKIAELRLNDCKRIEGRFPTITINYRTHYFTAQLQKELNPKEIDAQKQALEKALTYFQNDECVTKAFLLTLLYDLDEAYHNSPLQEVNRMYMQYFFIQQRHKQFGLIRTMVPEPRFHL
jgi:transcriptional regulator with XRE-family HTH domain